LYQFHNGEKTKRKKRKNENREKAKSKKKERKIPKYGKQKWKKMNKKSYWIVQQLNSDEDDEDVSMLIPLEGELEGLVEIN